VSIATLDVPQTSHDRTGQDRSEDGPPALLPLTRLRVGQSAVIDASGLDDAAESEKGERGEAGGAAMLRAMGLIPEAKVRICRLGEPCIVAVRCACGGQTRIGLARRVASRIMVRVAG
jgi:Fe2+ transport system protein FeoA